MTKKKFWLKVGKYTGRTVESFFAFLFFYLIVALYGEVIPVGDLKKDGDFYIYVQSNGIHTDVCLPVHSKVINWHDFIPTKPYGECDNLEFIAIGWGDKGFFLDTPTWAELKVSTALNAAFLPSTTAMHVMYCEEPMANATKVKVYLSQKQYKSLVSYVKNSFHQSHHKVELIPNKGYTSGDNFYEAKSSYHLFRTCNRWTNEALKAANVRTGVFALFPHGIISHLK